MITIMLENLTTQLQAMPGKGRTFAGGTFLFHQGDGVASLFLVLEGEVWLVRHQPEGGEIILQRAQGMAVLAEASLFSTHYHCSAVAAKPSRIYALSKESIFARLQQDSGFAQSWASYLAHEVQRARFRSELLSLKTVASRLDAWLGWQGGGLPPKGEWKVLAGQLGISPEALYREIARRLTAQG